MLTIDIKNQQVQNDPFNDQDVVVLRGASNELIQSLSALTLQPGKSGVCCATGHGNCCEATAASASAATSRKVRLANRPERISKELPQSILAAGGKSFQQAFNTLTELLEGAKPARSYRVSQTMKQGLAQRAKLQGQLASLIVPHTSYVETLRGAVQMSTSLNPSGYVVTTRNIQAALALYAYYSDDKGFTSTEACKTIAKHIQVSPDLITRLATELGILTRKGQSTGTRYFVSKYFGNAVILQLRGMKFDSLRGQVDARQNKIDALGSI